MSVSWGKCLLAGLALGCMVAAWGEGSAEPPAGAPARAPAADDLGAALDRPVQCTFNKTPWREALEILAREAGVPIRVDPEMLKACAEKPPEALLVTLDARGLSLESCA